MPNPLIKITILLASALLTGSTANAQEAEKPEVLKPIAYRGSFEATVDDKGNLVITPTVIVPVTEERQATRTVCRTVTEPKEETYTVEVDGKKETRTRTVDVQRQVSEQVPFTFTVTLGKPEVREAITMPKLYYFNSNVDVDFPISPVAPFAGNVRSSVDAIFVRAASDVRRAVQLFEESTRRHLELTGISPPGPYYIVVLDESYDETAVANARELRIANPSMAKSLSLTDATGESVGRPGTIVISDDSSDSLLLDTTYEVTICQPEQRTRTVNIMTDGQAVPKEEFYTVMVPHKEAKQGRLESPVIYDASENTLLPGKQVTDKGQFSEARSVLFVGTTADAKKLHHMLNDAERLLRDAGVTPPKRPDFIVVEGETFDYTAAAKANADAKMSTEPGVPSSAAGSNSAAPTWPLPTDKSAWIGSLPFTQKTLNRKAMVLWFFEEGCPKCKAKWRELNSLPLTYKGTPVIFVAVNSGNSPESVADYVKQNKVNLAVIADTDRQLEKLSGFGEISLNNVYQVAIMTPDGQFHPADANDAPPERFYHRSGRSTSSRVLACPGTGGYSPAVRPEGFVPLQRHRRFRAGSQHGRWPLAGREQSHGKPGP